MKHKAKKYLYGAITLVVVSMCLQYLPTGIFTASVRTAPHIINSHVVDSGLVASQQTEIIAASQPSNSQRLVASGIDIGNLQVQKNSDGIQYTASEQALTQNTIVSSTLLQPSFAYAPTQAVSINLPQRSVVRIARIATATAQLHVQALDQTLVLRTAPEDAIAAYVISQSAGTSRSDATLPIEPVSVALCISFILYGMQKRKELTMYIGATVSPMHATHGMIVMRC